MNAWQSTDYATLGHKTSKAPILARRNLTKQITLITDRTNENVTTIHFKINNYNITIVNIYDKPGGDTNITLDTQKPDIETDTNKSLVTGDFNAKDPSWGGNVSDKRGQDILEWTALNNILINNTHNSPPTFLSTRGRSWVDLTLTKNLGIMDWKVNEEETLRDHQYITFRITQQHSHKTTIHKKYNIADIDKTKLNRDVLNKTWDVTGTTNEKAIRTQNQMIEIIQLNTRKRKKQKRPNQIWWTTELNNQKRKTNNMRRKFQRETDVVNKRRAELEYTAQRRHYKDMIKNTKRTAIRDYFTNHDPDNPWNAAYKIIKKSDERNSTINTMKRSDGTYTQNREETIRYLHTKYFPDDNEQDDEDIHKILRQKQYQHTTNDKNFTADEITDTLANMMNKKATASDGLSKEFVQKLHETDNTILTKLYNDCLNSGEFPECWKKVWSGYRKKTAAKDQSAFFRH
ncbi:uncharacterized protein [Diabrotica undecimpunctata]|uniref:uncharacterized protein n=1 Tax=Diabrotica undecimpunctata TaxID=50387 RepID=UPI003B641C12